MIVTRLFNANEQPARTEKEDIVQFLHTHLEQYRDTSQDIQKAMDYALKLGPSFGGFILASYDEGKPVGAVVVNETGMKGYIPENILVYIATHKDYRGKGIGKQLMQKAIEEADGNIALHVEPENPARHLYEKLGFASKYIEMRLIKS